MYYLCSENKDADQLRNYCATDLICFRLCKSRFSHDMASQLQAHPRLVLLEKVETRIMQGKQPIKVAVILICILADKNIVYSEMFTRT